MTSDAHVTPQSPPLNPWHAWIAYFCFGLCSVVYFGLAIDPQFIYHWQDNIFYRTRPFFLEFLCYPGGLFKYAAAFSTEAYYYTWLGAALIGVSLLAVAMLMSRILKRVFGYRQIVLIHFLPSLGLLYCFSNVDFPFFYALGMAIALCCFYLYVLFKERHWGIRTAVFCVLSILLYYTAAGLFLVFAALAVAHEVVSQRKSMLGLLYLLLAAILPYAGSRCYPSAAFSNPYIDLIPIYTRYTHPSLSVYPPLTLYFAGATPLIAFLACALYQVYSVRYSQQKRRDRKARRKSGKKAKDNKALQGAGKDFSAAYWVWLLQTPILLLTAAVLAFLSYERFMIDTARIHYFARHDMWAEILQVERPNSKIVASYTILALYHQRRLLDDLFAFVPNPEPDHLLPQYANPRISDIYLEMGHVNLAQRWAHESLALHGPTPHMMQNLALISLLKGDKQYARKYFANLKNTFYFRDWAMHYEEYLDDEELLANDPRLSQIKASMPRTDFLSNDPDVYLELLSPNSRMAFEYLLAVALIKSDQPSIKRHCAKLREHGYNHLPRHCEEALVLQMTLENKIDQSIYGFKISEHTQQRMNKFKRIFDQAGGNPANALPALSRQFGGSYWLYYVSLALKR